MAELSTAVIGAGAALGAASYASASGFASRHENSHSLQGTEIGRHIADFETAYERGEVAEDDWQRARNKEWEYELSIEMYKEVPMYNFFNKWKKMREVRKKKTLWRANRSLRSHYYDSTSDASDTSSITAASGSPPRSMRAHSGEDDERILSWAERVASSDSEDEIRCLRRITKEWTLLEVCFFPPLIDSYSALSSDRRIRPKSVPGSLHSSENALRSESVPGITPHAGSNDQSHQGASRRPGTEVKPQQTVLEVEYACGV